MKLLRALSRAIDKTSLLFFWLASWLCLALVILTAEQVISRYLFGSSSVALQELEWHLFGYIFLLGAAHTLKANRHVRVDIFYEHISVGKKRIIDTLGLIFFVLPMSAILCYYGWGFATEALAFSNPHPSDHLSSSFFDTSGSVYALFSYVEAALRSSIIVGEISPDPGGLEARWIIKSSIPLGFLLLGLQGISEIIKKLSPSEDTTEAS